jgi:RNA polymerase sigma-70 factor (ECF subfamily)
MGQNQELAGIFESERPRLQRIAHRVLGDWDEAEDAVQETWLKTDKIPQDELRNVGA